jgi:outer membrane protein assembly complex protein YaeT
MRHPTSRAVAAALLVAAVAGLPPAAWAKTEVRIEGTVALTARSLREAAAAELAGLDDPARRRAAAADAAFQMESAGRRAGYAFIEIDYVLTGEGDQAAAVFTVREGPLVKLGEITFTGNAAFPASRLRPLVAREGPSPYVEADIRSGRKEVVQFYRDEGFAEVEISEPMISLNPDRSVADVRFEIVEGLRRVVRGVVFDGDPLPEGGPTLQKLASGLQGQPYFDRRGLALVNGVTEAFASRGYPDAAVTLREEQGDAPGDVVLRVAVASGPRVRISGIDIVGNERTSTKFILSRLKLKPGDWFNEEAVHEGFRELYRTGVITRVHYTLEGDGTERTLHVQVEEAPAREVSGEIGWGSYERLRGRVGYRDRNTFGVGLGAAAEVGASTKSRHIKTGVLAPRFLGTEYSLSFPWSWTYREEPAYTEEEVELSAHLYRLFPRRVTAGVKYAFTFDHLTHLSADVPPDARDEEYTTASVKANVEIDRRDSIFYPSRGWQTALAAELADQRLGGSLDFVRCTAGAKFFQPLGAGFVLGMRLDSGFIVPTRGNANIPVNERFFTGGESSVRSFEEQQLGPKGPTGDPLGGLASTVASVEVRRRIAGNLAGNVFVDVGNVSPNSSPEDFDPTTQTTTDYVDTMWADYLSDFRAGVGFGLQYLTPLGPIRLDLAWNPDPRESQGEERFVSHFSVGMAF